MIDEHTLNAASVVDRLHLIFGGSGSGKSVVITDLMYLLSSWIDLAIIVSPTNPQNNTYTGKVPKPCIHLTPGPDLLRDLWDRQNAFVAIEKIANNIKSLHKLFMRIANNDMHEFITMFKNKFDATKQRMRTECASDAVYEQKVMTLNEEYSRLLSLIYKGFIKKNYSKFASMKLSKTETVVLQYVDFNPRILLIFDDCTEWIMKQRKTDVMQALFFKGRWNGFTTLLACHHDKALDHELKRNAFSFIWTDPNTARTFFNRAAAGYDKEFVREALRAINETFTDKSRPHQKLIMFREEMQLKRFTATLRTQFRFGSEYVWRFCEEVESKGTQLPQDNKFIRNMLL